MQASISASTREKIKKANQLLKEQGHLLSLKLIEENHIKANQVTMVNNELFDLLEEITKQPNMKVSFEWQRYQCNSI